jgi:hypothetical protein
MFKKLTLAAAAGAGYVLGAKAGKERYAQIEAKFREVAGMPAVQNATSTVKENAAPLLDSAKQTATDKVSSATDKATGKLDKASGKDKGKGKDIDITAGGTGATTRSTAAAGAAPSRTAPVTRP